MPIYYIKSRALLPLITIIDVKDKPKSWKNLNPTRVIYTITKSLVSRVCLKTIKKYRKEETHLIQRPRIMIQNEHIHCYGNKPFTNCFQNNRFQHDCKTDVQSQTSCRTIPNGHIYHLASWLSLWKLQCSSDWKSRCYWFSVNKACSVNDWSYRTSYRKKKC